MSTDPPIKPSQDLVTANRIEDSTSAASDRFVFTPPIDIFETADGLVLRADLPGVSLESLELQIQDNRLTLFGRVETLLPEDAVAVHREFEVGDFLRSFILSDEVDYDRITARLSTECSRSNCRSCPSRASADPGQRRIAVNRSDQAVESRRTEVCPLRR
ncbi:MAG: hypothetical protein CM1200mP2_29280 [Planctomycetaceae bacterium]|nr:MAG: hypothetical protein CM1200mP2_29280 [Planctomycetaceae bacterium]